MLDGAVLLLLNDITQRFGQNGMHGTQAPCLAAAVGQPLLDWAGPYGYAQSNH